MSAVAAHEGQLRGSGEPYVTHPVAVTHYLATLQMDAETLAAFADFFDLCRTSLNPNLSQAAVDEPAAAFHRPALHTRRCLKGTTCTGTHGSSPYLFRFAEEFQRFSGAGGSAFANDDQYSSRQMAAQERDSGQIV